MTLRFKVSDFRKTFNAVRGRLSQKGGNVLVYIVMLMVIFAVLGVAMVSLFSTSIGSSATVNDSRRATYLSDAGIRYAASELRAADFSPTSLTTLNNTVYTVSGAGRFDLNVFSPWFESASIYDTGTQSVNVDVPEGEVPAGYLASLPAGDPDLLLVNYNYFNLSNPDAQSPITGFTAGTPTSFQIQLSDDIVAHVNEQVAIAVSPFAGGQTLPSPGVGVLDLKLAAKNVFPQAGGAFTVKGRDFYYKGIDTSITDRVRVMGVTPVAGASYPDDTTIAADDPVILTPLRNRLIVSEGRSGQVTFGNNIDYAAAIVDHSPIPTSRKPDIEFDEEANLPGVLNQIESPINTTFFDVDNTRKEIVISGNSGSGAIWFQDTRSIGGQRNFCQANLTGQPDGCLFRDGIRVFYIMNYSGDDGDGFTFSIINGTNNDISSVGGDEELSELLAYAGDSRQPSVLAKPYLDEQGGQGIEAPKMAVEFDGKLNNQNLTICANATTVNQGSRFDPDFGLGNNRDTVQYVFWGKDSLINAPCRINPNTGTNKTYDDNRHDAVRPIWDPYNSGSPIVSTPAVNPSNGNIYFGSSNDTVNNDGKIIRLNSNGTFGHEISPDGTGDDDVESSPALDSSGYVYIGSDDFGIYKINPEGNKVWSILLDSRIESRPAVSNSTSTVYVATEGGTLYAIDKNDSDGVDAIRWTYPIGSGPGNGSSSPIIKKGTNDIIYVGSLEGRIYAIKDNGGSSRELLWKYPNLFTIGPIQSTPAENPVTGDIYFGSNDDKLYAITKEGIGLWSVPTNGDVISSPVVTSDGTRVYVGSNDGHLYSVNTAAPNDRWLYPASGSIVSVESSPWIDDSDPSDVTIYFGSNDGHLYAAKSNGALKWKFPATGAIGAIKSSPVISNGIVYFGSDDGKLYAIDPGINDPPNLPNFYLTSAEVNPTAPVTNNWFSNGPWAVRMEVERSQIQNLNSKYEYILKTWMRKCQQPNCEDLLGTFFQDTRIKYDYVPVTVPPLALPFSQTIELSQAEHDLFNRFIFGFTSATSASQSITISKFQLSFVRPNDLIIINDDQWLP
jgi:outer membrane protein assembly factor BamB